MLGGIASRFVEGYPADAARVLEQADPGVAGQILAGVPADSGAALLRALTPHAAAQCLACLPVKVAAALIADLPAESATPLLLRLDDTARAAVLGALPAQAAALRRALRFAAASVGALIDADVLTVRAEMSLGDAAEIARRAPNSLQRYLYVLDGAQRLAGVVDVRQCVLEDAAHRIGAVMQDPPAALRARTGLRQASQAEAWEWFDVLPVTDYQGVFLGVVRRDSVVRAMSGQRAAGSGEDLGRLAFDLAELYWDTTSRLILGATQAGQPGRRAESEE